MLTTLLASIAEPVPRSSHGQVVHALGTDIVLGQFPAGTVLPPEAELIRRFGVSRTVLREGVKTLAAKGMVVSKTRVGTRVRERTAWNMFDTDVLRWCLAGGVDRRFLRDLAEIRLAVEPAAAALAAARRDADGLDALDACVAAMRDTREINAGYADADLAFHLALADASDNLFMRSIGGVIEAALLVSFRLSRPADAREHERSWQAHRAIVDAIRAGDAAGASAATEAVIRQGLANHGALDGLAIG
jgi:DNA-binding FadR family transcriptional regulator